MSRSPTIRLHADDAVLIARTTLLPGVEVAPGVVTSDRIPAGHKVAIRAIAESEPIRR
jgi:altronate hydrolase